VVCSSLLSGVFRNIWLLIALIVTAGFASLFHLGRKFRAWRAVSNVRSSPLSREIVLFIIFSVFSIVSIYLNSPGLLVASSVAGLALLLVIDSVYIFSDNSAKTKLHAGQTFLSGMVLTSLLAETALPFIFLAFIKLMLTINNLLSEKRDSPLFILKFFRIAILLIASGGVAAGLYSGDIVIYAIIFAGELLDRVIFYHDFNPENIKSLIIKNINKAKNEKEID
jgi:DMSO reductase anchor subunit